MASQLESILRDKIAKGFKSKLLVGTLSRVSSAGVDEYGDPIDGAPVSYRVEGFVDALTSFYKAQAGLPEETVKVVLIAGNSETAPLKDDVVSFRSSSYRLRTVQTDPALAAYECEAFLV